MKQKDLLALVRTTLNDSDLHDLQSTSMCRLWGGMGHIYRVKTPSTTMIIKHVQPPPESQRSFGDRRKWESYQVEARFYEQYADKLLESGVGLPRPLRVERRDTDEIVIVMTELVGRPMRESPDDVCAVLDWLARFHAAYWQADLEGLQAVGSYWHLDTRPDEHTDMSKQGSVGRVKLAARAVDERLKRDRLQCLIHGDAKSANILIDSDNGHALLCDFQYSGRGPPSRDLIYFLCSSVDDDDEESHVAYYHQRLVAALPSAMVDPPTLAELQDSMDLAAVDYFRFMAGWGFWGSSGIEERVAGVMQRLDGGRKLGSEEAYEVVVQRECG